MKSALLTGALCLGIGLGVGAFFAGPTPTRPRSGGAGEATAAAPAGSGGDVLTRAELAGIVRQELARERGAGPAALGAAEVRRQTLAEDGPVDRDTLAPEVVERAERASQIVSSALGRGAWTEADKDALTQQFEGLPGAVKAEIAGQLAAAVNRGEVRLDLDDLPL